MAINNRPTFAAVIMYYILALGMFILYGPSTFFYLNKCETQGEVYQMEAEIIYVKFSDSQGKIQQVGREILAKQENFFINQKVKVYYNKMKPTDIYLPDFEGYPAYWIHIILLLMAVYAVFTIHRDYLKD